MHHLLTVNNLTTHLSLDKGYVTALDSLSFFLERGKTTALVGESGSGKSMTALSLMRLLPRGAKVSGEILFHGKNILALSERSLRGLRGGKIAMIFQDPQSALNPVTTIDVQLKEVCETHLHLFGEEAGELSKKALYEVGIDDPERVIESFPHQLSGGQKQRVVIAMAMLVKPDLLIADEPTTALDVTVQKQILDLMRALQKKEGMAILLITHDMGIVYQMADEVMVMYAGRIVERASKEELFKNMAHPYTQALFKALPQRHRPKERLFVIPGQVPTLRHLPHGCHFHPRCPFVFDRCKEGAVPDFTLREGHSARCWLYERKN